MKTGVRLTATDALSTAQEKTPHSMKLCGESAFKRYSWRKSILPLLRTCFCRGKSAENLLGVGPVSGERRLGSAKNFAYGKLTTNSRVPTIEFSGKWPISGITEVTVENIRWRATLLSAGQTVYWLGTTLRT